MSFNADIIINESIQCGLMSTNLYSLNPQKRNSGQNLVKKKKKISLLELKMSLNDPRIIWIKNKVESGLYLEFNQIKNTSNEAHPFKSVLERDGNLSRLSDFLNATTKDACVVFWAQNIVEKILVSQPAVVTESVEPTQVVAEHENTSQNPTEEQVTPQLSTENEVSNEEKVEAPITPKAQTPIAEVIPVLFSILKY